MKQMRGIEVLVLRNGVGLLGVLLYDQPLSSGPKTYLNTTVFAFLFYIPFARNLHNLEPLALTLKVHKETQSKGGLATHTRHKNQSVNTHTSRNKSS